ncbi:hypothetical protein INT45_004781 [Circinella minor]|uniref:Uncharacterized protein n=1 Tax=Circinella minor TaxID=1195481 RepID=A0A8H7VUN3_9FUNG|nr:hypothetical protein INT45_004781 [Circinella minor]
MQHFYGSWSSGELDYEQTSWCSICRGVAQWWRAPPGKWDHVRKGPPYIPNWKSAMLNKFTRP